MQVLNRYYQRTGFYDLLLLNMGKVCAAVFLLLGLYLVVRPYLSGYQNDVQLFIHESLSPALVFGFFYVSESVLGLIPPDLFMVWAKVRYPDSTYLVVTGLAMISYLGGITAYLLGGRLEHLPSVHAYVFDRHQEYVQFTRKWGGVFVLIAALFPIPFAMASTVAGLVGYSFKAYLLFGLARFLRFYVYAMLIFNVI